MRSSVFARAMLATAVLSLGATFGVAAQSDGEMPPVQVAGVVVFDAADPFSEPTSSVRDGAVTKHQGISAVRHLAMSDERLSGSQRAVWNQYDYGTDGSTVAGRLSIENDDGSWQGTYQGVIFPHGEGVARHQAVLVGDGAYESLSAVLYYDSATTEDTLGVEGFIFQGEIPEHPALD